MKLKSAILGTIAIGVNCGVYHIFENHYNYKFLRDGPTDPYEGLNFNIIRLNAGDVVPDDGKPLATD